VKNEKTRVENLGNPGREGGTRDAPADLRGQKMRLRSNKRKKRKPASYGKRGKKKSRYHPYGGDAQHTWG